MKRRSVSFSMLIMSFSTMAQHPGPEIIEKLVITGVSPLGVQSVGSIYSVNQVLDSSDLAPQYGPSLARLLDSQLFSVSINDVTNNPFQPDVQYRGFTASPLLGLPQGLSVYLNGTRFNEPFGDTVNWDLLPTSALEQVSLVAGANPLFGQNTLGGALVLRSKNGFNFEQNKISLQAGDFGQQGINFESGGNNEEWAYYVNVNSYQEDGWRDYSDSEIKQLFSTISYQGDNHFSELTLAASDNRLIGNGAIPVELIPFEGRDAIFTRPDQTETALRFISLKNQWTLSEDTNLVVNAYYRKNEIVTYNGDDSDYEECDIGFGETLCVEDEDAEIAELDDDLEGDDEAEEDDEFEADDAVHFVDYAALTPLEDISSFDADDIDGTANTSLTKNQSSGISAELSGKVEAASLVHHWTAGLGIDVASIDFSSDTEFAILNNDSAEDSRDVMGIGVYDLDSMVRLTTDVRHLHLFFSDNIVLNQQWSLQLSGRYNRSDIDMVDGVETGPGSLNGEHQFNHFNPSFAVHYQTGDLSVYSSYSQSSRTPSPAELSCADEDDPCKLPNGFVADPPLEQVVTNTIELGAQWQYQNGQLSAAIYSSDSKDDIIFQQAGDRPSVGYFVNVDKTRRQGIELGLAHSIDKLDIDAQFSYLQATFESSFMSFSPQNPLGPNRQVNPRDKIPGQPTTQASISFDYAVSEAFALNADINYSSSQYFRGDEANENRQLSGYTIVNLAASYGFENGINLAIRLENAFDEEFETFGTYGEADEVLGDLYPDIESPEFIGPGQPRTLRLYASYAF
ncbi:TonB-dependent receptor [Aliiglaciecola lipolytica]|uniref:TonB-dependent receptor n=1 Tax=Aliiglaciecola lipolytica TaxID=477689 RepID=UPI00209052FB|nr:TonB-dependent receptor [Aliiglaciecola lipolytica]